MTADRLWLQAQLDLGGVVELDSREYVVDQGGPSWCLDVPPGVTLRGQPGTVLRLADSQAGSVRILRVGAGCTVSDLTLDGNSGAQTPNEHRHGAFVIGADVTLSRVTAMNCTGDGIYLYTGAHHALVDLCLVVGNQRNGITLNGAIDGATVSRCDLHDNRVQQIDHEPVGSVVSNTLITGCTVSSGTGQGYAITLAGWNPANPARGLRIVNCDIDGPVQMLYVVDAALIGSRVTSRGKHPAVHVYRWTDGCQIQGCSLAYQGALDHQSVVFVQGTAGQGSSGLRVVDCDATQSHALGHGVRIEGASSALVSDVRALMTATIPNAQSTGVRVRATAVDRPMERLEISDCKLTGFSHGAIVAGNGAARLDELWLTRNRFQTPAGVTMSAEPGVPERLALAGNQYSGGRVTGIPTGCDVIIDRDAP